MLSINIYWNTNHLYVQNKYTYDIAQIYFPVLPLFLSFEKVHLFNINFVPIPAIKAGDSFNSCVETVLRARILISEVWLTGQS